MGLENDAGGRLQERSSMLVSLLRRGKRDHQRSILMWGGLRIVSGAAIGAIVLLVLGGLAPILPRVVGVALAMLAWGGLVVLVWRHWIRPLRAVPNLAVFSRLVEERRDFRDMLRAALEFSQRGAPEGGSVELVVATVDRAYDEARALDLQQLFQVRNGRRDAGLTLGGALAIALLALLVPDAPQRALRGLAFAYPTPQSVVCLSTGSPGTSSQSKVRSTPGAARLASQRRSQLNQGPAYSS
ncbi:MAG: hypothetical protein ACE5G2_13340, partial [Candidatus Krumholzibacteriia bacterium]